MKPNYPSSVSAYSICSRPCNILCDYITQHDMFPHSLKLKFGSGKMTQWVKVLLSSLTTWVVIPGIHMVEGENWPLQSRDIRAPTYARTHIRTRPHTLAPTYARAHIRTRPHMHTCTEKHIKNGNLGEGDKVIERLKYKFTDHCVCCTCL